MLMNAYSRSIPAFTLVEIVVTATILVILTSIWFYSYTKNISDARDSARVTDISALSSQLSLYKRERWAYPHPWDRINLTNWSVNVALQWRMNQNVSLSTATILPSDPELDIPYFYGTTSNRQEFQIAASMENSESPFTYLKGDYKSIARTILPNILMATDWSSDIDVASNGSLFLFQNWFNTLPYDFVTGEPFSDGTSLTGMLDNVSSDYWQNTDYRSCSEIELAGKNITASGSSDTYETLDTNGELQPTICNGIL